MLIPENAGSTAARPLNRCGPRRKEQRSGRNRIGSVPQDPPGGDITVLDAVLEGRRRALEISGLVPAGRIPATTGATT